MRLDLIAIGRLRGGEERALIDDYLKRASGLGRGLGLAPLDEREIELKGHVSAAEETAALARAAESSDRVCLMDERGDQVTSRQFAALLAGWRDDGASGAAFLIGGADGFDPASAPRADKRIALGKMTWPHRLARVMLAEQIYRAMSILAGSPYHRD